MTITVTPTVEASNLPPRVRLNVTASAGETSAVVTRLNPDGTTSPVRTNDGGPLTISAGTGLVYDYEAPFGAGVRYSSQQSPATISTEVVVDEAQVWLIHPGVPSRSMPVRVAEFGGQVRPVDRGVHRPLGRKFAVVQTDGQRKAPEGTLTLRTDTLEEMASLLALIDDAGTLLFNVPVGLGWGFDTSYLSVGDVGEERLVEYAPDEHRYWPFPYTVVDRPEGGTQAARTFADVLADNATFADVLANYSTFAALLAGP